ncbi:MULTISPECIES: FadR/GntR family transcriptional regulator [unclassified Isoptericola]|uniref:FadR/GntR family transcriptional regulator n=1 Tax=Isoptericola sp. NPDC057191 TaxID=3346041 RepID=UPI00362E42E9
MTTESGQVPRPTLSGTLADAVIQLIGDEGLVAGERIGPQRDLAARFGVAVPTMREALRRLEGMGILSFRHGSGIYVGENYHRSVLPNAVAPPADRDRLITLIQARAVIEPAIARQAAVVREPTALARLADLLAEARECLETGADRLWRVNVDLHRAVADAAGNTILSEVLDVILLLHAEDQRRILALHGDPESDYEEHAELVRLVTEGRPDAVADLMHAHLTEVVAAIAAAQP